MKLETFFEKFDQFAEAPDAVSKIRELLRHLAVTGKLVPQDPNDGDAREMIDRAMAKRQQTIKTKSLRRKELDESAALSEHEDLPSSWCVERFANLVDPENTISYGVLVPGNDVPDGVPFVRAQDLCLSNHPARPNKTIAPEIEKPYSRTRLTGGEILLCVVGSIGKLGIVPDSWAGANIARAVARIKPIPDVLRDYLLLVLQDKSVQNYFASTTRTLAQPTLNVGMIEQTPIPVPPVAEQKRIVAKVDELMALCDRLEAQQQAREEQASQLAQASMARFTDAPTPANLPILFHPTYTIPPADLRKSILTLAVQGKLVPQAPNDEPAEELLWKILGERERLVKARRIRRLQLPPLTEEDEPFSIPQTWIWTRLGSIGDWGSGSTPPRGNHELYGGKITWLKSGELNDTQALVGSSETVTELSLKTCSFRQNKPGDVLIAMYGATIGKLAILAEEAVTNQAVCGCTPFPGILNTFLFYYLLSRRDAFHAASEGGAQPNISKVKIVNTPFPLPPIAEQGRIVEKVEHLMALVSELEALILAYRTTAANLLSAIVSEITVSRPRKQNEA